MMPRTPCNTCEVRNICNDLQALIWTIPASHSSTPLFKVFHIGYAVDSGFILYCRSCSVSIIIYSTCQFIPLYKAEQP